MSLVTIHELRALSIQRTLLWSDIPEYLRLDPSRAMSVYAAAANNPYERAEHAIVSYYSSRGCQAATWQLMRHWGHEFFEKCKINPLLL